MNLTTDVMRPATPGARLFDGTFHATETTNAVRSVFDGRRIVAVTDHGDKPTADWIRYGAWLAPEPGDETSVWFTRCNHSAWSGIIVWATAREIGA